MLTADQNSDANLDRAVIASSAGLDSSTDLSTATAAAQLPIAPIFAEATTQAVRLLRAPVAILMTTGKSGCQISSIAGLERFVNLPAQPNLSVELAGLEYCYAQVMSCESKFCINNCQHHSPLAELPLVQSHGVQAYLGIPIVTAARDRLGTIAILDFKPRQFNHREIELLHLISRLVASEFERKLLSQAQLNRSIDNFEHQFIPSFDDAIAAAEHQQQSTINEIDDHHLAVTLTPNLPELASPVNVADLQAQAEVQLKLMTHLAQELRTPLTSILGMASVLQQEIYGVLSGKQKDYIGIIYQSGQQLASIVDEISQLSKLDHPTINFDQDQSLPDSTIDRAKRNLPISNPKH